MRARGSDENGLVTRREKVAIFFRSFLLQSVWNPRGMQSVGFCFAMLPALRRPGENEDATRSFLRRHLSFFNTNPAMASYVLGSVAAAEARGEANDSIEAIKKGLSGPLGMSGDALFWGSARPFAGLFSVVLLQAGFAWAPVALLAIYNVPHFYFRARGLAVGAADGPRGAAELKAPAFRAGVGILRSGCAFLAGALLAMAGTHDLGIDPRRLVAAVGFFAVAYAAARFRIPVTLVALVGAVMGLLFLIGLNGG